MALHVAGAARLRALLEALRFIQVEGGSTARLEHYRKNYRVLVDGMTRLGFRLFLDEKVQAPIIVTFRSPADPRFQFDDFYAALAALGFIIYPGKLTREQSFRIGCIGALEPEDFIALVSAIEGIMTDLGLPPAAGVGAIHQISR